MTLVNLPDPYLRQQGHGQTHTLLNPLVNDLRDRVSAIEAAYPYMASVNAAVDLPSAATAGYSQAYLAASVGGGVLVTATTVGVYVEWTVVLAAGTYSLNLWHSKAPDAGIVSISIDGATALATKPDGYAAGPAVNTLAAVTGAQVLTSGRHTVRLTGATKHASSSAYGLLVQSLSLTRTGNLA